MLMLALLPFWREDTAPAPTRTADDERRKKNKTMQAASERIKGGPGGALVSHQEGKTKLEDHKGPNHLKQRHPMQARGAKNPPKNWTLRERG